MEAPTYNRLILAMVRMMLYQTLTEHQTFKTFMSAKQFGMQNVVVCYLTWVTEALRLAGRSLR